MKKLIFLILTFLLCKQQKDDIELLLEKNELKYKKGTICSCGKTMDNLLDAKSIDLQTPKDLERKFGKWDTTYSEITVISCSSFVFKCTDKFVSFHYQERDMKFIGRSYGEIVNGKFEYSGNLIEL